MVQNIENRIGFNKVTNATNETVRLDYIQDQQDNKFLILFHQITSYPQKVTKFY